MVPLTAIAVVVSSLVMLHMTTTPATADRDHGRVESNANGGLRDGWYPNQPKLSPSAVADPSFGKIFESPVDGWVYAQPIVANNVLLIGTATNNIYGLDPVSGARLWHRNLGQPFDPAAAPVSCSGPVPSGITSTPVVDEQDGTAYFVSHRYLPDDGDAATERPSTWEAHAVDVATGAERPGWPVTIAGAAQNNPSVSFRPSRELQRPGLLLMDGVVYAAFAGFCDRPTYQGWIAGISTATKSVRTLWVARGGNASQNGAGIWQSGGGLASDGNGRIFGVTGNGGTPTGPLAGSDVSADLGQSAFRLQLQPNGSLKATDFFSPFNAAVLDRWDADFGSTAPVLLDESYFGTPAHPRLMLTGGKEGYFYLLDRDHLGGMGMGPNGSDDVVQRIGKYGGVWSRPSVWPGEDGKYVYMPSASDGDTSGGNGGTYYVFKYGVDGAGNPSFSRVATSDDFFGYGSGAPVVTSNGTEAGSALVWAPQANGAAGRLRVYRSTPVDGKLVTLREFPIGRTTTFASPGVGDGRIYVGTRDNKVIGFGSPTDAKLAGSGGTFPRTVVGATATKDVTVTAFADVTVTGLTLAPGDGFALAGDPSRALPATLHRGDTMTVPVSFTPSKTDTNGGLLTVETGDQQVEVSLSGVGVSPDPELSAFPRVLSFSSRVGGAMDETVTLTNVGAAPVEITGVGDIDAPFSLQDLPPVGTVIQPGDSVNGKVSFAPGEEGSFTDELQIATNANEVTVGLSGVSAEPPVMEISPQRLVFPDTQVGQTAPRQSFTVKNTGGSALHIMKNRPPTEGQFKATVEMAEGLAIAPGASITLSVDFKPTAAGTQTDYWTITGDDDGGLQRVELRGQGDALGAPPSLPDNTWAVEGSVNAIVRSSDRVYLGGSFSEVGPSTGPGTIVSNALGKRSDKVPQLLGGAVLVRATISDGEGGWYVGGDFILAGGISRKYLVHLLPDYSVDPAFVADTNGAVWSLRRDGDTLYLGGSFTTVNGQARANVAAVSATTGAVKAWNPAPNGIVYAIASTPSAVYLGGDFTQVGGVPRARLAAVTPAGTVTGWDPSPNASVRAVLATDAGVYVGGAFKTIGGASRNYLALLDPTTGAASAAFNPSPNQLVLSLAGYGGSIYVGGQFTKVGTQSRNYLASIDPSTGALSSWDPGITSTLASSGVWTLGVSGNTIYVGGGFTRAGGADRHNAASYLMPAGTVTDWNPDASDLVYALAPNPKSTFLGGRMKFVNGYAAKNVAVFSAATGQRLPFTADTDGTVKALRIDGSSLYLGGLFTSVNGTARRYLAKVDASTGAVAPFNAGIGAVSGGGVNAIAVTPSGPVVGGTFSTVGSAARQNLAVLDATTGAATASVPAVDGAVVTLEPRGGTVFAGGTFAHVGSDVRQNAASFAVSSAAATLTEWDPAPNGAVKTLAVDGDRVYLGGSFTAVGSSARSFVAAVGADGHGNPDEWAPVLDAGVNSLTVSNGKVVLAGTFTTINGLSRPRLAGVSVTTAAPSAWNPTVNGAIAVVHGPADGSIYIGGASLTFTRATQAGYGGFSRASVNTKAPVVRGTATVGSTLTCSAGLWAGTTPRSIKYQWNRNGTPIAGATAADRVVVAADAGTSLSCTVTATNIVGAVSVTTAPTSIP